MRWLVALLCLASVAHAQGVVRVTTEATCANARHQCTYSQRVNPTTGTVLGRGSITISNMGHQTAPAIVAFDSKSSWLITVSDGAKQWGGLMLRRDFLGGWPIPLSSPFVLDYDPRAAWNGDPGVGKRVGVLWRQVRRNDDKLNAAREGWKARFLTFDVIGGKILVLSDVPLTEWSIEPGLEYGYPLYSRWTTSLTDIPGAGWAVGLQSEGQYVVGQLTETGQWVWQRNVNRMIDYAGDAAVSRDGQRIGSVTTVRDADGGVRLEVQEDAVR